jgi:hypothetical protein
LDEAEVARLGRVLAAGLRRLSSFWRMPASTAARPEPPADDLAALGWPTRAAFAPVAREVVVRDIVDPLATLGIVVTDEEREELGLTEA